MLASRVRMGSRKKHIDEVYLAQDNDFSGTTNGSFGYIGTELEVKIPHIIKGVAVTSYSGMFYGTNVTKVVSDNPNVTNMRSMFYNSKATSLDLSSFDTSNVTDIRDMFQNSSATTGYARTQADADKFNATRNKPAGLNFVVKP